MRIAVLTGLFPVLSENPFLNQITGLVERGHDVDIYADQPQPGVPAHPDIGRYGLLAKTRHLRDRSQPTDFGWRDAFSLVRTHQGQDRRALLRTLNPFRFRARALSLEQFRQTAAFLPRRYYDVCYCPFAQDARKSLRFRDLGVLPGKLVVALRGSDISRYLVQRGKRVYRRLFREGDLFLPVCEAFARRIVSLGCSPDKVEVHHTGINLARFPYKPRQSAGNGTPLRLLTVGRLVEKKGIEYGLQAVRKLLDDGLNVRYEIVGDGPMKHRLEREIERMDLGSRVCLSGWHTDVHVALERADVLLAPCVTAANGDEEGIPNVLREGMAAGLPVISTHHSGIPELINHGINGYLVPERDSGAIVERIRRLAANPEAWSIIAAAARRKVEEDDLEDLNDRLVRLFEGVLRN